MDKLVRAYVTWARVEQSLRERTVDTYRRDLEEFVAFCDCPLAEVDRRLARGWLAHLVERGDAPSTRHHKLSAVKSFFRFLVGEGLVTKNPVADLPFPKVRFREPAVLTEEQCRRLLATVREGNRSWLRQRDLAAIALMLGAGLRISEVVGLDLGDLNLESEPASALIERKGGDQQRLPLNAWVEELLCDYLAVRPEVETDALFVTTHRRRWGRTPLGLRVKRYLQRAGLPGSAHTLRHTFATLLLARGVPITYVQRALGHHSLKTTAIYLHLIPGELEKAVEALVF